MALTKFEPEKSLTKGKRRANGRNHHGVITAKHRGGGNKRLYRMIDLIGRWSNIDIFMLSILVALVQFGVLSHVRAGYGAMAFAGVVVVTMVASRAFDSRLMWDAARSRA